MQVMSDAARKELHEIIDTLPDSEVPVVRRYIDFVRWQVDDPVQRALDDALEDDEEETADEVEAVARAREEIGRGGVLSHDEMKRRLGL